MFADGRLFKDFATGETLDAPALLARVEGITNEAACRLFIELAGVKREALTAQRTMRGEPTNTRLSAAHSREPEAPRSKPELLALAALTTAQLRTLAELRGLSVAGMKLAAARGFLRAARWFGADCWALTDAARWLCQLRRLDGKPFTKRDGGTYKARTCAGSWAGWPLGIGEAAEFPSVALVEGGPDFLAACHFIAAEGVEFHVAPVGLLGSAHRIASETLPHFAGKRVRIFAHADAPNERGEQAGIEAAARWESQLADAGATVTTFDLSGLCRADGKPVKDLNDAARIAPADCEREPELSALMTF